MIYVSKFVLDPNKFFDPNDCFGPHKILVPKSVGPKNFLVENICLKDFFGIKFFDSNTFVGSENILGPK